MSQLDGVKTGISDPSFDIHHAPKSQTVKAKSSMSRWTSSMSRFHLAFQNLTAFFLCTNTPYTRPGHSKRYVYRSSGDDQGMKQA